MLATTATANARVVTDVAEQLGAGGRDVLTLRGPLARESLRLGVLPLPTRPSSGSAWLVAHLDELPGLRHRLHAHRRRRRGRRRAAARGRARRSRPTPAAPTRPTASALEAALRDNEVKALVATTALGMGFDKPDLGFVVHLGAPVVAGRLLPAGRPRRPRHRARRRAAAARAPRTATSGATSPRASCPREEQADAVLRALAESGRPLSTAALETVVDLRRTRLELLLKVLDVDGAVQPVPGRLDRRPASRGPTTPSATPGSPRPAGASSSSMLDYERTDGVPDGVPAGVASTTTPPRRCGRCDRCAGAWFPTDVPDARGRRRAARASSRAGRRARAARAVADRHGPARRAAQGQDRRRRARAAPGRAVARLTDLGWGQRLRELLARRRARRARPTAAARPASTCSRDWGWARAARSAVVADAVASPAAARRLAGRGHRPSSAGCRCLGALDLVDGGPTGEPGGNSAFRLAGRLGRASPSAPELATRSAGSTGRCCSSTTSSSRWTITVAGAGAAPGRRAGRPAVRRWRVERAEAAAGAAARHRTTRAPGPRAAR